MKAVVWVVFCLQMFVFLAVALFGLLLLAAFAGDYWRGTGIYIGRLCAGLALTALGAFGLRASWLGLREQLAALSGDAEAAARIQARQCGAVKWVWRVNGLMIFLGAIFMVFILVFSVNESVGIRVLLGSFVALVGVFALVKAIKAWQA